MRTFRGEKLVRDNIPEKMKSEWIELDMCILWDDEYIAALIKKTTEEEYQELLAAHKNNSMREVMHEAADIYTLLATLEKYVDTDIWLIWEVKEHLMSILDVYHIDEVLLWNAIKKKHETVWVFDKRYYIHTLTAYTKNSWVDYWLTHPDKYPLIVWDAEVSP